MRNVAKILFIIFLVTFVPVYGITQNDTDNSINQRTPEQEATKQTEKLQTELNLTPEQVKAIYQINLRYAQARKNATRRADAMQIIKNKDENIRKILTPMQNQQLESRRTSRQQIEVDGGTQHLRTNPVQRTSREDNRRGAETRSSQNSSRESNYSREPSSRDESSRTSNSSQTRSSESRSASTRSSSDGSRSTESRSSSSSGNSSRSSDSGSSTTRPGGRR